MRITFAVVSLALLVCASFLPMPARAQFPGSNSRSDSRSDSIVWDHPNPTAARKVVLSLALYNDLNVTVAFAEHRLLAGEIADVNADDFTLRTQFSSQPVSIPFAEVHSLRWMDPRHGGRPHSVKAAAERLSHDSSAMAHVQLRNHQKLQGHVSRAGELDFTFVVQDSNEEKTLRYRDVDKLSGPSVSSPAEPSQVFGYIVLAAAGIVMLPLMLLAMLSGWDGC